MYSYNPKYFQLNRQRVDKQLNKNKSILERNILVRFLYLHFYSCYRHTQIHTDEKPYCCNIYDSAFSGKFDGLIRKHTLKRNCSDTCKDTSAKVI